MNPLKGNKLNKCMFQTFPVQCAVQRQITGETSSSSVTGKQIEMKKHCFIMSAGKRKRGF